MIPQVLLLTPRLAAGYHGFASGQSLVLGMASMAPTEGGWGCVRESLKALELIPLAHRVMVERALAASTRFGDGKRYLARGGARSRRIRLADRVVVKRALVPRQTRVARHPRIREARRSSSPSATATVGPPIMAAAIGNPRSK